MNTSPSENDNSGRPNQGRPTASSSTVRYVELRRDLLPLPNYTLSDECPACGYPTIRRACKVRCERCGFLWDCSEL